MLALRFMSLKIIITLESILCLFSHKEKKIIYINVHIYFYKTLFRLFGAENIVNHFVGGKNED